MTATTTTAVVNNDVIDLLSDSDGDEDEVQLVPTLIPSSIAPPVQNLSSHPISPPPQLAPTITITLERTPTATSTVISAPPKITSNNNTTATAIIGNYQFATPLPSFQVPPQQQVVMYGTSPRNVVSFPAPSSSSTHIATTTSTAAAAVTNFPPPSPTMNAPPQHKAFPSHLAPPPTPTTHVQSIASQVNTLQAKRPRVVEEPSAARVAHSVQLQVPASSVQAITSAAAPMLSVDVAMPPPIASPPLVCASPVVAPIATPVANVPSVAASAPVPSAVTPAAPVQPTAALIQPIAAVPTQASKAPQPADEVDAIDRFLQPCSLPLNSLPVENITLVLRIQRAYENHHTMDDAIPSITCGSNATREDVYVLLKQMASYPDSVTLDGVPVRTHDEEDDHSVGDAASAASKEEEEINLHETHDNECNKCSMPGLLICCETCSRAYHLKCIDEENFSKEDLDDDLPFYCNECCEDDFLDDDDLKQEDFDVYKTMFVDVHRSLETQNECSKSLMTVCRDRDAEFERITEEIEKNNRFVSKPLYEAEALMLQKHTELEDAAREKKREKAKVKAAAAAVATAVAQPLAPIEQKPAASPPAQSTCNLL